MIDHAPMQADSWEGYRRVVASLKRRNYAVDVGSNTGTVARRLGDDFRRVDCYEPMWDSLPKGNLHYPSNATIWALGLSDMEWFGKVYVKNAWTLLDAGRSGIKVDDAAEFIGKSFTVKYMKLDDHSRPIDFLKIDVDGAEWKVLLGGSEIISANRPVVMMELSSLSRILGEEPNRAALILFGWGYYCVSMDGKFSVDSLDKLMPYWPHHTSYDVLFIPNEITLAPQ